VTTKHLKGTISYEVASVIGRGGMATVHMGKAVTSQGQSRVVAFKQIHTNKQNDLAHQVMLLDEARIASRLNHPALVGVDDVIASEGATWLVMDYIHGESLALLLERSVAMGRPIQPGVVSAIIVDALRGLHAAHEATDSSGVKLDLVHRDVSPQNILVGVDGYSRLIDFGVAKALGQQHVTATHVIKGKIAYTSPEYLEGRPVDRRSDLFSMGIVLWESLCCKRLFQGDDPASTLGAVLRYKIPAPTQVQPDLSESVDSVTLRALQRNPKERFASALDFTAELETAIPPASRETVSHWMRLMARESLAAKSTLLQQLESQPHSTLDEDQPAASSEHAVPQNGQALFSDVTRFTVAPLAKKTDISIPVMHMPTGVVRKVKIKPKEVRRFADESGQTIPTPPQNKLRPLVFVLASLLLLMVAIFVGFFLHPPPPMPTIPPWPPPGFIEVDGGNLIRAPQ
jgi:eukaryotic-like serine/threonine-protein kinase